MAYKPTTGTSILDNDFRLATSEGVYEALQLKQDALPSQSGNEDKVLVSDGSDLSWQYAGLGAGSFGSRNVILGRGKPSSLSTATDVVLIGQSAGAALTTGTSNIAIGDSALSAATVSGGSIAIGRTALSTFNDPAATWKANIAIGSALTALTTGFQNIAIGNTAGSAVQTGTNSVYVGFTAAQYNTGSSNTAIGFRALQGVSPTSSGNNNVAIGAGAAQNCNGAINMTAVGLNAGLNISFGYANTLFGYNAGSAITTGGNNVIIGNVAGSATLASTMIFAAGTAERFRVDSSGNMGIGTSSPAEKLDVSGNVKANSAILNGSTSGNITLSAADTTTSYSVKMPAAQGSADMLMHNDGSGNLSWNYAGLGSGNFGTRNVFLGRSEPVNRTTAATCLAIGEGALNSVTTGSNNLAIGYNALQSVTTGVNNFVLGISAGLALTTNQCTIIGHSAGRTNATGANVVYVGFETAQYNTGPSNTAIGFRALRGVSPSSSGSNNVAIGMQAAQLASASNLVVIGRQAGFALTTGSGNILIGETAGDAITTGTSNTIIGDIAGSTTLANTMIFAAGTAERFRVDSSGNMGIGTSTPGEKLEVAGAVLATEYRVPNYRLDPHTHDEGTETGNFTINWTNGAVHTVTLNAAGPLVVTMSNPVNGGAYALRIIQGATPGTVTWPANVKWPGGTPPTLSSSTGDIDIVNFLYFDDGGGNTFYYGTIAQDFA